MRRVIALVTSEARRSHRSAIAFLAVSAVWGMVPAVANAQDAAAGAQPPKVLCASKVGARQSCPADTRKGVDLVKSIGPGACELGRTWGYDHEGIWVSEGCSAEFSLGTQPEKKPGGNYAPRAGYTLVDADKGNLRLKLLTYVRYLNQRGLDETFTDSFGTTSNPDLRQDFQLNKVSVQFLGWALSPKLRWLAYVWTSNPTQGMGAQVVVGGWVSYNFNRHFSLGGGINALPGVRSTEGSFPLWLTVDNRLIADEFFRPSFTQGLWAKGDIVERLEYYVQVGNNMSALGVDASQLDNDLDTWSGSIAWLPTTGEFGSHPSGFGDWDWHKQVATRFGVHYTHSGEDAQSQPNTDLFENVTIRLSDGNSIFKPALFGPAIVVRHATYRMVSAEAAAKYHGLSLEGEYYWRFVGNFVGPGTESVPHLRDNGFQLQASAMPIKQTLQVYGGVSKIFGQHGDPGDVRAGINLYPWKNQAVRWNNEVLYLNRSPVGGLSLPYVVGGRGYVFYSSFLLDL